MVVKGLKKKLIKSYFYLDKGLDVLNKFKYQGAGILALYYLLKFQNPIWIPLLFLISIPALILLGWLWIKRIARTLDKLNTDKGTYYSIYSFNLQEDIALSLRRLAGLPHGKRVLDSIKPREIK